jgi:chemotaxis protein histidine kinase CheA
MVSVRDVSLLKQVERDALRKKDELDIISQLINVPSKKYLAFVASAKKYIEENRSHIVAYEQLDDAVVALLFRNMHTSKGNSRTFGFQCLGDVVHDVESVYSELKGNASAEWDRDFLLRDLERVESVLKEYERIYNTVLGRDSISKRDAYGFWADKNIIDSIQVSIEMLNANFPVLHESLALKSLQTIIHNALSHSLSEVLADVINSLSLIAQELGKNSPTIVIEDNGARIPHEMTDLLTDIFTHILRNSMDHGIELPDVRIAAGKPPSGTINIRAIIENEKITLKVNDDGQGLSIDRLFKKGVENGVWKEDERPSFAAIADLIFASGVSTKEQVSTISGRGVGMDAVKQFLLNQGGNIRVQLLGPNAQEQELNHGLMIPFSLVIELPKK